jgi:hypothetical protein
VRRPSTPGSRRASKIGKKELTKLASEQANVLAFADRNREIVELPEGLETGKVKRRKRGARTDRDCIDEICELIAQGATATSSVRYVGVSWATWQKWLKLNHERAAGSSSSGTQNFSASISSRRISAFRFCRRSTSGTRARLKKQKIDRRASRMTLSLVVQATS